MVAAANVGFYLRTRALVDTALELVLKMHVPRMRGTKQYIEATVQKRDKAPNCINHNSTHL